MAHLVVNEFIDENRWKGHHASLLGILEEFATSGGDLNKKNSDGITPIGLSTKIKIKGQFGSVITEHMKRLNDHQKVTFIEINGLSFVNGERGHSIYETPTDQMFNLVSQNYDKLTEIAKERIPNLVASGINLDAKNEGKGKTILGLATENWGDDKALQLSAMVGIAKEISNMPKKSQELKELSDKFDESLKIFSSDKVTEKKQSKQR